MKYKIYQPAKSSMQSGLKNTKKWCLEVMDIYEKKLSPTFGWISSENTNEQVKLIFDNLNDAVEFAKKKNLSFEILINNQRKVVKKSYADNFKPKKT